jgi:hypothetical protein
VPGVAHHRALMPQQLAVAVRPGGGRLARARLFTVLILCARTLRGGESSDHQRDVTYSFSDQPCYEADEGESEETYL